MLSLEARCGGLRDLLAITAGENTTSINQEKYEPARPVRVRVLIFFVVGLRMSHPIAREARLKIWVTPRPSKTTREDFLFFPCGPQV
jgi:hypothetical protein